MQRTGIRARTAVRAFFDCLAEAVCVSYAAMHLGAHAAAAQVVDPAIAKGRQQIIESILTTDPPGAARWIRFGCAFHDSSEEVAKGRTEGRERAPDAGDSCVAALTRQ